MYDIYIYMTKYDAWCLSFNVYLILMHSTESSQSNIIWKNIINICTKCKFQMHISLSDHNNWSTVGKQNKTNVQVHIEECNLTIFSEIVDCMYLQLKIVLTKMNMFGIWLGPYYCLSNKVISFIISIYYMYKLCCIIAKS